MRGTVTFVTEHGDSIPAAIEVCGRCFWASRIEKEISSGHIRVHPTTGTIHAPAWMSRDRAACGVVVKSRPVKVSAVRAA